MRVKIIMDWLIKKPLIIGPRPGDRTSLAAPLLRLARKWGGVYSFECGDVAEIYLPKRPTEEMLKDLEAEGFEVI